MTVHSLGDISISRNDLNRFEQRDGYRKNTPNQVVEFVLKATAQSIHASDDDNVGIITPATPFFSTYLQARGNDRGPVSTNNISKPTRRTQQTRSAYLQVKHFIQDFNLFSKEFVIVPIYYNLCWSVMVICHPDKFKTFLDYELSHAIKEEREQKQLASQRFEDHKGRTNPNYTPNVIHIDHVGQKEYNEMFPEYIPNDPYFCILHLDPHPDIKTQKHDTTNIGNNLVEILFHAWVEQEVIALSAHGTNKDEKDIYKLLSVEYAYQMDSTIDKHFSRTRYMKVPHQKDPVNSGLFVCKYVQQFVHEVQGKNVHVNKAMISDGKWCWLHEKWFHDQNGKRRNLRQEVLAFIQQHSNECEQKRCATCGKTETTDHTLNRCKCHTVYYCNSICQRAQWSVHRKTHRLAMKTMEKEKEKEKEEEKVFDFIQETEKTETEKTEKTEMEKEKEPTLPSETSSLPTFDKQHDVVHRLWSQYVNLPKHEADLGMVPGDEWYVLDAKWWDQWISVTHYVPGRPRQESDVLDEEETPPPAINNDDLIAASSSPSAVGYTRLKYFLRETLDYVLVPREVWHALHDWYGGGPTLARQVVRWEGDGVDCDDVDSDDEEVVGPGGEEKKRDKEKTKMPMRCKIELWPTTIRVPKDCSTLGKAVGRVHKDDRLTAIVLRKGEHQIDDKILIIPSAMNIVGDPGVLKSEIVVVGGIAFKPGIRGNCHLQHLTLRQGKMSGVVGFSFFTMEDVLVEQCGMHGVWAGGTGGVGRCTNVEVRQCGLSGVHATNGASITLIGQDDGASQ